ncbi:hypothetical protein VKT23_020578 [Stygiomarasmius scandens]|uniref:Uncharacterized protein n=1 Tax=Marasmiellus scandens TaxID=2682957 RepID=A0ABR1IIS2_9AGAR
MATASNVESEIIELQVDSAEPESNDKIKTEFHPSTNIPDKYESFDEFGKREKLDSGIPLQQHPWEPFPTRFDYEVAEFALQAGLNKGLTDELINLIHKGSSPGIKLSINNSADMDKLWDMASFKSPEFQKTTVAADFQKEEWQFDLHFRPLWDWVMDIATNKELASELVWDACHHYKFDINNTQWEWFIEESWSADLWWRIQNCQSMENLF